MIFQAVLIDGKSGTDGSPLGTGALAKETRKSNLIQ